MYIDTCEQWGFPGVASDWEDPLKESIATHSSILAGKSHGQRRLAGYSTWGREELEMTEVA